MTVKEYLSIHCKGIGSIGIYDMNGDWFDTQVDILSIFPYLEKEIDRVGLGIFDEVKYALNGERYESKYIRACIYLKEIKEKEE